MAVIDHLRELRRRLIIALLILAAGGIVGWFLYPAILEVLKQPYCALPPSRRLTTASDPNGCDLLFRGPLDGFTIRLKVSMIAGALLTSPLWLLQLWGFITPGLKRNEKKYTYIFIVVSTALFLAGVALAYAVLYKGLAVLVGAAGAGTAAALDVTGYINFVVLMMLVFGAAFELPLIIVMANLVGALPYSLLRRAHRIGIFLIFLFAAVATPTTDPFTMIAMAVPMVVLFELAVLFAYLHDKRKAARRAAAAGPPLDDFTYSQVDPVPAPLESAEQPPRRTGTRSPGATSATQDSATSGGEWSEVP